MANVRILLGQFMKFRNVAEVEDRYLAPGGQLDKKDSFLEIALPNPDLVLGQRREVPTQSPPDLGTRQEIATQPAPTLDAREEVGTEGPPPLDKPDVIPFEPAPPSGRPSKIAFQPPPAPGKPSVIPFVRPPPLDSPRVKRFQRPPTLDKPKPPAKPGPFNQPQKKELPGPSLFIAPGKAPTVLKLHPFNTPAQHGPGGLIDPAKDTLSRLKTTDSRVLQLFKDINELPLIGGGIQGAGELDPILFARSVARAATHVGAARLALHGLVQTSLYARNMNLYAGLDSIVMSKAVGWNPGSVFPLPGEQLFTATTVDGAAMMNMGREARDEITRAQSEAVALLKGTPKQIENKIASVMYNDVMSYKDKPILGVTALVEDALSPRPQILESPGSGMSRSDLATFPQHAGFKLKSIFLPSVTSLGTNSTYNSIVPRFPGNHTSALAKSAFTNGIIPVKFAAENARGFLIKKKDVESTIGDDDAYVPLSFTDLRPYGGSNFRSVFFRPFITSLSEDFTPEWNKASYNGRVDPVATYQGTGRSINLSFMIVSFGPEDVEMVYKKLNWLTSMVYPEYDKDLAYRAGPVVRLRVGDVINANGVNTNKGLPGIIDSLSYDYSDQIWELKKGLKVPRNIVVSLTFTVLHDMPVGIGAEGKFGGLGSIDNEGRYSTPNASMGEQQAGKEQSSSPEVVSGLKAFRSIGKDPNAANNYSSFNNADSNEKN